MPPILIALFIGIIAGAIDIVPMIKNPRTNQKMYRYSIMSVFLQWVFLGLIIPFVNWQMAAWAKGIIIGALGMAPTMILTYGRTQDTKIAIRIFVSGGVLGCIIGAVSTYFNF